MIKVCASWKWCSECRFRETEVVKTRFSSGVLMGFDKCVADESRLGYVYPSIGRKGKEIGEWCPYYAEAMVEGLNNG